MPQKDNEKDRRLWDNIKKVRKYAFWIIIICLIAMSIKDVVELCIQYAENPKNSEMEVRFNESMALPNITFCMSKEQAMSHFRDVMAASNMSDWDERVLANLANMTDRNTFLKEKWDYTLTTEAYEVVALLNTIERELTPSGTIRLMTLLRANPRFKPKRDMIKLWMGVIAERNVTFKEFTQKVGVESLRRSIQRFVRTTYNEDKPVLKTKIKISWISTKNLCFQPEFDEENYEDINDQGQFFILQTSTRTKVNDSFDCMSVDFHGRPSLLGRFAEGKGRSRDGIADELCLGQNHEVTVEVRASYTMLENDEEGTACNCPEPDEDTEFDCRSRCRLEMIKDMCNCIPPTLSYLVPDSDQPMCDYTKCVIDPRHANHTDELCTKKCLRDCRQIRYQVTTDLKGRSLRGDLTTATLHWGSFEYLSLEQKWQWTVPTFIAALGGSVGLWLGLSFISLLQFLTWVSEKVGNKYILEGRSEEVDADGKPVPQVVKPSPRINKDSVFDVQMNDPKPKQTV